MEEVKGELYMTNANCIQNIERDPETHLPSARIRANDCGLGEQLAGDACGTSPQPS